MDAPSWTGDDNREFGPAPTCDQCDAELYPEERASGRCRRCVEDALATEADDRSAA